MQGQTKFNGLEGFIQKLERGLPESTANNREDWAETIDNDNVSLSHLIDYFLESDKKVLSRFLWMLSDIGSIAPHKLLLVLTQLLSALPTINIQNVESTFANYWLLAGIPEQDEAIVIDLLLGWINSSEMNVTTKSRSIWVIEKVIDKYPDFKNEFKLCLELQTENHSADFQSKVQKIIASLN